MAAVIIRKKDVERLGKEVLKEVYEFLHDDYIITDFKEMKIEQEKLLKGLVYKEFEKNHSTVKRSGDSWEFSKEEYDESKYEKDLKRLKSRVENGRINTEVIFETLYDINLDDEIDEDLYYKTKAFLNIYKVFDQDCSYLED